MLIALSHGSARLSRTGDTCRAAKHPSAHQAWTGYTDAVRAHRFQVHQVCAASLPQTIRMMLTCQAQLCLSVCSPHWAPTFDQGASTARTAWRCRFGPDRTPPVHTGVQRKQSRRPCPVSPLYSPVDPRTPTTRMYSTLLTFEAIPGYFPPHSTYCMCLF